MSKPAILWILGTPSRQSNKLFWVSQNQDVYDVKVLTHTQSLPSHASWPLKQIQFSAGSSYVTPPQSGHPSHSWPHSPHTVRSSGLSSLEGAPRQHMSHDLTGHMQTYGVATQTSYPPPAVSLSECPQRNMRTHHPAFQFTIQLILWEGEVHRDPGRNRNSENPKEEKKEKDKDSVLEG